MNKYAKLFINIIQEPGTFVNRKRGNTCQGDKKIVYWRRGETMELPKDPAILLSFVNMKLRDLYPSLSALCDDLDADEDELRRTLSAIGYEYSAEKNAFV